MIFIENRQSNQNCETLLMESYNDDNFSENELLRAALPYYTRGKRDCSQKVHFPRRRRFAICLKNPCYMNISFSPRIERPSTLRQFSRATLRAHKCYRFSISNCRLMSHLLLFVSEVTRLSLDGLLKELGQSSLNESLLIKTVVLTTIPTY